MSNVFSDRNEHLDEIIKASRSKAEVFRKLGIEVPVTKCGGWYKLLKQYIFRFNVDVSHMQGKHWSKGKKFIRPPKLSDSEFFSLRIMTTSGIRNRYLALPQIVYECSCCKLSDWCGKDITLQVDHINGNNLDNRLENLRLLCPNCHSQTVTYGSRNKDTKLKPKSIKIRKTDNKVPKKSYVKTCPACKLDFESKTSTTLYCCKDCRNKSEPMKAWKLTLRKTERPSLEQLLLDLKDSNYCAVGRKYGVSDNCIRKWIKQYTNQETIRQGRIELPIKIP